ASFHGSPDCSQLRWSNSGRNVKSAARRFPILAMPGKGRVGGCMLPSSDVHEDPNIGEVLIEGEFDEIGAGAHRPLLLHEHDVATGGGLTRWHIGGNLRSHIETIRPRRLRPWPLP